jgi:hypothetical protein
MKEKTVDILTIAFTVTFILAASIFGAHGIHFYKQGSLGMTFTTGSIHATITMTRNGEKIFEQYHAGSITIWGSQFAVTKICNTTEFNATLLSQNCNLSWISIGNKGALGPTDLELPGEWNRTLATQHDFTGGPVAFNLTAVFHPGVGPYTADCIGINYEPGIGNGALFGYDTFAEVPNIDNTYTITAEFIVTVS